MSSLVLNNRLILIVSQSSKKKNVLNQFPSFGSKKLKNALGSLGSIFFLLELSDLTYKSRPSYQQLAWHDYDS